MADLFRRQSRVFDGLTHSQISISRAGAHEAVGAFVDMLGRVNFERACDLTAKTVLGHFGRGFDARRTRL